MKKKEKQMKNKKEDKIFFKKWKKNEKQRKGYIKIKKKY